MIKHFKSHPYLVAMLVGLFFLALSIPGINIYHHIELPVLDKYRVVTSEHFSLKFPFLVKRYDITLETEVFSPNVYKDVAKALRDAGPGDTVVFHLSGFGGREDEMFTLINQVKNSKAPVIMSVEGPVYSAYAYLALSGNKLEMSPYTFLMFHFSSVLNMDCSKATGVDRGTPNQLHCEEFFKHDVGVGVKLLRDTPFLTVEEKAKIGHGYDVYLTPEDMKNRGAIE